MTEASVRLALGESVQFIWLGNGAWYARQRAWILLMVQSGDGNHPVI